MTAGTVDRYSAAKAIAERAEETLERRRGELIAAVIATDVGTLPPAIDRAAELYVEAEDALDDARERCLALRRGQVTDDDVRQRVEFARLSALVAVHVMGWAVAKDGSPSRPWRIVEANGKRRELPNFAGDMGAVARAEQALGSLAGADAYGAALAHRVGTSPAQLAMASPYSRVLAMLKSRGVPQDAEPRTVAH